MANPYANECEFHYLTIFLLMAILAQSFLALVSSHFMTLTLLSARHSCS